MRRPHWLRRRKDGTEKPNAVDLWVEAGGDPDRYAALLADAGLDRPVRDATARDLQGDPRDT